VELPDWNLAEREQRAVTEPMRLPDLCEIPSSGQWPVECWRLLDVYDVVAMGNYEIAQELAAALRASDASYDALLGAAKIQQELSQIRQQLLEKERTDHTVDNWWHRGIILLMGAGIAL
jgi:hypothetical protein